MKTNEKIRNIMLKMIITILVGIIAFSTQSLATNEFKPLEKSAEFEKWENLSEKDRKNSIQPTYYNVNLKQSIRRSNYNTILRGSTDNLGADYNLAEKITIKNKDQGYTGSCWAFSYSSVLETTMLKKRAIAAEYSPIHMDYIATNMFTKKLGDGGNSFLATAYCISGNGPVLEEDMPFEDFYNVTENEPPYFLTPVSEVEGLDIEAKAKVKETTLLPSISKKFENNTIKYYQGDLETEYSTNDVNAIRNIIKKHILENGAISAIMYTDIQIDANGNYTTSYYNKDTAAYFCNDNDAQTNHAITIVGWDDNYPISNFREDCEPSTPGAYIILNSYGTEFGKNGYMYVSYEDLFIENSLLGIKDIEDGIDYDKIYQYDELGANQGIGAGTPNLYAGVKFTRDNVSDKKEYLNEIGIYLLSAEGVEIYLNKDSDDLQKGELIYSSETALEAGYHTIELASPIELTEKSFAIKVKYINQEGATLPLECNIKESGFVFISNYFDKAVGSNKSFLSIDGNTWQEINGTQVGVTSTLKNTDACIKAFTTYSDTTPEVPVTGVQLSNSTLTIEEGTTQTLIETVEPSTATNKNVTWSSSNEEVATVDGGVVTANSEGETTITVTTEDGGKTATCKVTVTAKEQEIIAVESVSLDKTETTLRIGETVRLIETISPNNATNKRVTWSSSNGEVATVDGGVVTANSEGEATITVTTEDGSKKATCKIIVENEEVATIHVEGITLDENTKTIQVGDTTNLIVSFTPSNPTNKNIKWESSNTNVATVSERGIITGISEGKTIIKAISEDGNKEATCELTVVKKTNTDDDIYKDNSNDEEYDDGDFYVEEDDTLAKNELPNTGVKFIVITLLMFTIIFAVIKFVKYRNLKDIK